MDGGKDSRMRGKRKNMKQYDRRHIQHNTTTSSSSAVVEQPLRSMIDVADSSDERYQRGNWVSKGKVAPQRNIPTDIIDDHDDADHLEQSEQTQMQAGDFDLMSQLPTSGGGHFQFSSERNWESDADATALDNTEASEYFTLNLKLINAGLQTIPFHKRLDYSSAMFTFEQLNAMEQDAEAADKTYQNVLREHQTNPRIKINSGSRRSASAKSQVKPKSPEAQQAKADAEVDDELDELLNMTTSQVAKVDIAAVENTENVSPAAPTSSAANATATVANGSGNKDDIQQWLDNVLEE